MKVKRMNKINVIGTILLFLFLSGCALGPDFMRPVVETPKNYRFEKVPAERMINLKWWELFNDPVLYTLVTQALTNNKDLKIAAVRVEQARAYLGFTRADQYPGFYIEAGAGTGNFAGGSPLRHPEQLRLCGADPQLGIGFLGKIPPGHGVGQGPVDGH